MDDARGNAPLLVGQGPAPLWKKSCSCVTAELPRLLTDPGYTQVPDGPDMVTVVRERFDAWLSSGERRTMSHRDAFTGFDAGYRCALGRLLGVTPAPLDRERAAQDSYEDHMRVRRALARRVEALEAEVAALRAVPHAQPEQGERGNRPIGAFSDEHACLDRIATVLEDARDEMLDAIRTDFRHAQIDQDTAGSTECH